MNQTTRGKIEIDLEQCKGCGLCIPACPVEAIRLADRPNSKGYLPAVYRGTDCTACGICFYVCPEPGAITVFRLENNGVARWCSDN